MVEHLYMPDMVKDAELMEGGEQVVFLSYRRYDMSCIISSL